ncbi:MAG: DinB family protein [Candidatus Eisenbacteria bacterium]|uniref:DinB family protein n=1 Tax=Eiseniibacteriota bacterium TaxID=2212470 RepID=A0A956RNM5_UNCEI|nr:DinB family protein [Candidatus Eisenbacteria bacterium]
MNESDRLAKELELALHGGAWHGPSWREIVNGVGPTVATRRPLSGVHSIAELVAHAATWNEVVVARLGGGNPAVTPEENFPRIDRLTRTQWRDLVARFLDGGDALVRQVREFPPTKLHERRPRPADGTWQDLILGQLQHLLYHGGQVALLKKGRPAR